MVFPKRAQNHKVYVFSSMFCLFVVVFSVRFPHMHMSFITVHTFVIKTIVTAHDNEARDVIVQKQPEKVIK